MTQVAISTEAVMVFLQPSGLKGVSTAQVLEPVWRCLGHRVRTPRPMQAVLYSLNPNFLWLAS